MILVEEFRHPGAKRRRNRPTPEFSVRNFGRFVEQRCSARSTSFWPSEVRYYRFVAS